LHGVAGAVVTGGTAVIRARAGGHDSVVELVGQVSDLVPRHLGGVMASHKLADAVLEALDEVMAEVVGVAFGDVGDSTLELVGVVLDRGGLTEGGKAVAGLGGRVGVTHALSKGVSELVEGSKSTRGAEFLALSAVALRRVPRVSGICEVGGSIGDTQGLVEIKAHESKDHLGPVEPRAKLFH
jgi:hypothetical protein